MIQEQHHQQAHPSIGGNSKKLETWSPLHSGLGVSFPIATVGLGLFQAAQSVLVLNRSACL